MAEDHRQQQQDQQQEALVIFRPWESDDRSNGKRLTQMSGRMGTRGTSSPSYAYTSAFPSIATWSSGLFSQPHPLAPHLPSPFCPLYVSIPELLPSLSPNISGHHTSCSSSLGNSSTSHGSWSEASSFHKFHANQDHVHLGRTDSNGRRSLFSAEVITILRDWYKFNIRNPYPTSQDMCRLSRDCGLTKRQIQKWISNRRDRTCNTRSRSVRQRKTKVLSSEVTTDDDVANASYSSGFARDFIQTLH